MSYEPTPAAAERLFGTSGFPLISIYMPTHRARADVWQDPIRFRNLLRSAEHELEAGGVSRKRIEELLAPLAGRLDDREFWQHQGDGLALFRWSEGLEEFRLSMCVPELCVVGARFHVKPLLLSLANQKNYFILALSRSRVRLFRASASGLSEVEGLDWPRGVDGDETDPKAEFAAYCRHIDRAVAGAIGAGDLVILAAVDHAGTIFREVSTLRGLSPSLVAGCPETSTQDELLKKSAPIAEQHFSRRRAAVATRFSRSFIQGLTLNNAEAVIDAARQGRIDTLLVPVGVQFRASVGTGGSVTVCDTRRTRDEDLLNLALIETWKSGGQVEALRPEGMLEGFKIAAITRD